MRLSYEGLKLLEEGSKLKSWLKGLYPFLPGSSSDDFDMNSAFEQLAT